jgi:hypothetical protein
MDRDAPDHRHNPDKVMKYGNGGWESNIVVLEDDVVLEERKAPRMEMVLNNMESSTNRKS